MIPETLAFFWTYIFGGVVIVYAALKYERAVDNVHRRRLARLFNRLGVDDIE